jgi:hypothetical protein
LEKHTTWTGLILRLLLPIWIVSKFVCDVAVAFAVVLSELLMNWIYTAFVVIDKHGIVSFLLLCLPAITLILAAYVAKTRIQHPFFGYHYSEEFYRDGTSDQDDSVSTMILKTFILNS